MEGYLKVTPEQLLKAADAFSEAGGRIRTLTTEMMGIVTGLKGIWEGEAAENYIGRFSSLEDDIMRINNMISEHVKDLGEMARTYQAAEDAGVEAGAALLGDVVS
ncbi:MAG: WXG100 family type VII secretion target [Lachnospiraceae bacterium]|nr:WXG100 family type VII secretion target [Lachnospiraceae bacterium]